MNDLPTSAQDFWKDLYRQMRGDMYFEKYDELRIMQARLVREAALERIIARLQRENAALKKYCHDPRVPIVPRDPRWSDDET